jgi:hypothetical protein
MEEEMVVELVGFWYFESKKEIVSKKLFYWFSN